MIRKNGIDANLMPLYRIAQFVLDYTKAQGIRLIAFDPVTLSDMLPPVDIGITEILIDIQQLIPLNVSAKRILVSQHIVSLIVFHIDKHKPLCIIYLAYDDPQIETSEFTDYLQTLAAHIAYTFQAGLLANHYKKIAQLERIINRYLGDVEKLFNILVRTLGTVIDTRYYLSLLDYDNRQNICDLYEIENQKRNLTRVGIAIPRELEEAITKKHVLYQEQSFVESSYYKSIVCVPIIFRDEVLGLLTIKHIEPFSYSRDDISCIELVCNQLALAFSNMRLFNAITLVKQVGDAPSNTSKEASLQQVMASIHKLMGADITILHLYSEPELWPQEDSLFQGNLNNRGQFYPANPGNNVALGVLREGPLFCRQASELYSKVGIDVSLDNFQTRENIQSVAAFPLSVSHQNKEIKVGVLFVNFRYPQRFSAFQRQILQILVNYVATAVWQFQELWEQDWQHEIELKILQEIDNAIIEKVDDLLNIILDLAAKRMPDSIIESVVLLYNSEKRTLESAAHRLSGSDTNIIRSVYLIDGLPSITLKAFNEKQYQLVNDVTEERYRHIYDPVLPDIRSELAVPLMQGNNAIGVINFESKKPNVFNIKHVEFAKTLAGQVIIALSVAKEIERRQENISSKIKEDFDILKAILAHRARPDIGQIWRYSDRISERLMKVDRTDETDRKKALEFADDIKKRINSIKTIFNSVIFNMREDISFPTDQEPSQQINLLPVIVNIIEQISMPNIEINLHCEKGVPFAKGYRNVVINVFDTLVKNAYEAMSNNQNTVHRQSLSIRIMREGYSYVRVEVEDTGPGVDDITKENLFSDFLKPNASKEYSSGSGLYLCQAWLRSINGTISLDSSYQGGARFIVRLEAAI